MKKTQTLCVLICSFTFSVATATNKDFTSQEKKAIATKIKYFINKANPYINVGIDIRNPKTGTTVFQRNTKRIYTPASTLKVLTGIASLDFLGPNYQFTTKLLNDGNIQPPQLQGSATIQFSGDPTLTIDQINALFDELHKKGVTTITGNLYVDNTAFGEINSGPGWMWDELRFCYAAPINAVIVNHNCMPFSIYPSKTVGAPAEVKMGSSYEFFDIENNVKTVKSSQQAGCPLEMNIDDRNKIKMSGCIAPGKYRTSLEAAVTNVDNYIRDLLKESLVKNKITLKGHIEMRKANKNAKLIAAHKSKPLSELLKPMLKDSDNVIANALYKKVGQNYYNHPATWSESQKAELALLKKYTQMPLNNVTAVDGAGLSRYNQVTPNAIMKALVAMYNNKNYSTFYNALPVSGIDGTLRNRMGNKEMIRKVHAKTGSMTAVKSIAGYVQTAHHGTLAFTILVNGFSGSSYPYRQLQDNIISYLAKL